MESSLAAPPIENIQAPVTQLQRSEVVTVVDEGLGRFLQKVTIEASCDGGLCEPGDNFEGFRIVELNDKEFFAGLGIGPGDVVTRINGKSIERDTQAYAAFVGLKTAPSLDIDYLRGGRLMHLSLPIMGKPVIEKKKTKPSNKKTEKTSQPSSSK